MNIEQIKTILIVGAGTMGQQIGLQCAIHGYDVVFYDVSTNILEKAKERITTYTQQIKDQELFPQEQLDNAFNKMSFETDASIAAKNADILSESVPEIPELKAKIYQQFNNLCPEHTIFTTNTSSLLPSDFAEATGRPDKFAALHFHQFVWDANFVDVMSHEKTSAATMQILVAFAKTIGQIPIVLQKEVQRYGVISKLEGNWFKTMKC